MEIAQRYNLRPVSLAIGMFAFFTAADSSDSLAWRSRFAL